MKLYLPYEPEKGEEPRVYLYNVTTRKYSDRRKVLRRIESERSSDGNHHPDTGKENIEVDTQTTQQPSAIGGAFVRWNNVVYKFEPLDTVKWKKDCYSVSDECNINNNRITNVYKLNYKDNLKNFRDALLLNLVPKKFVDEMHVHGCKEVLIISNDIHMIREDSKEVVPGDIYMVREDFREAVPGHVRVDENGFVSYSVEDHTLTNREAEILMKQLIEGIKHIYSVDPSGNVKIHSFVIANGRLKFILGMTTPDNLNVKDRAEIENLLGMPGAFFAATGVRTKRFEGNRYKLPEEIDDEFYLPLDKHFRVCVLFLLELFTGGSTIFDEPTFNDERYKLLTKYHLLSRNPIPGWEVAAHNSQLQSIQDMILVIHRVRKISPRVLPIFNGVLDQPAYCRIALGFAHWFLQEGYRVLSSEQVEQEAVNDALENRAYLYEPTPLGEGDSNNMQIDNIDQEFAELMKE